MSLRIRGQIKITCVLKMFYLKVKSYVAITRVTLWIAWYESHGSSQIFQPGWLIVMINDGNSKQLFAVSIAPNLIWSTCSNLSSLIDTQLAGVEVVVDLNEHGKRWIIASGCFLPVWNGRDSDIVPSGLLTFWYEENLYWSTGLYWDQATTECCNNTDMSADNNI